MYSKSRTDSIFTPLPSPLPTFPAAGQIFRDPSFNPTYPPTYVRLTDPSIPRANAFSVGTGGTDDEHFNLDDTLLWVTNDGAAIFVFGMVPETLQTGLVSIISGGLSFGNGHFSQVNPRWFYTLNPLTGQLWRLDLSGIDIANPNDNPPATLVFDFTTVGLTPPATFAGIGGNDTVFTAYFGAQDQVQAVQVAAYNARNGRVSIYNTMAGTVDGIPVMTPDKYFIHGAHLPDPNGYWMWVTRSDLNLGTPLYAWAIGSPIVIPIGPFNTGHVAGNAKGLFNNAGFASGGNPSLLFRRWVDFGTGNVTELNLESSPLDPTLDLHPTCKNDPHGISLPIFASTYAPTTTLAYQNEIIAWCPEPGLVRRFGRTFNSDSMAESFQGQNAIGVISSSGKFFAFTTDGQSTLGPNRTDVFILVLPE